LCFLYENLNEEKDPVMTEHESLGEFALGTAIGLTIGAVAFTSFGRSAAKRAMKVGAGLTEAKVEELLRLGEEKLAKE